MIVFDSNNDNSNVVKEMIHVQSIKFYRCGKNILMFMGLGDQTEADKNHHDLILRKR